MSDSAARAERFGLPGPPPNAYLWEVSNKPVTVWFNLETVDRLEREVVESFRSLSSRGSEIGGLLLGSIRSGSPAQVSVEAYELVPCDYARGPLYQFSEADVERFDGAAAQPGSSSGLRVVGFFRSHTRKGLGLDAEDQAFFTGHFRDPQQIALLIRPYASKPSTAGIFIWENGAVRGESSYLEFPFRRAELERRPQTESKALAPEKPAPVAEPVKPAGETPSKPPVRAQIVPIASRREIATPPPPERSVARPETPPEATASPRPAEKPKPEPAPAPALAETPLANLAKTPSADFDKPPAPPEERERESLADLVLPPLERPRRSNMVWITAGSAAVLLLLSGALIYPGLGHKARRAPALPGDAALSLRVERSAGDLLLTWNRDSDAIKNAARAVLTISDGDQHENVNLDLAQLRNGSVSYSPATADVSFQLSIVGQNAEQTHSESVRVLKTRPSPMADTPSGPQSKAAPPSRAEIPATAGVAARAVDETLVADNRTKPASPAIKEFRSDSLASRVRPAAASTDLPEAPGVNAATPAAVAIPGLNTAAALPPPPPVAPPPPAAAARPAALKTGGQLQSARLISSAPPEYPLVARQEHVQGVVVVSATIGTDGKIKSASAVSGPPLLQKSAVEAVKRWVYQPTTLNGAPVESETRVEVRFAAGR